MYICYGVNTDIRMIVYILQGVATFVTSQCTTHSFSELQSQHLFLKMATYKIYSSLGNLCTCTHDTARVGTVAAHLCVFVVGYWMGVGDHEVD